MPFSTEKVQETFSGVGSQLLQLTFSICIQGHWSATSFDQGERWKVLSPNFPLQDATVARLICRSPCLGAICLHLHHWSLVDLLEGRITFIFHCCMLPQIVLMQIIFWWGG